MIGLKHVYCKCDILAVQWFESNYDRIETESSVVPTPVITGFESNYDRIETMLMSGIMHEEFRFESNYDRIETE